MGECAGCLLERFACFEDLCETCDAGGVPYGGIAEEGLVLVPVLLSGGGEVCSGERSIVEGGSILEGACSEKGRVTS